MAWLAGQPAADVRFVGGLDYGFSDADGFAVVMYSISRPERWLVYEYKARRTGIHDVATAIKDGLGAVERKYAGGRKIDCPIHADAGGGGAKISYELSTMYGLPVLDAWKQNKPLAVEQLQEEVRTGRFKVRRGGPFEDEAMKTVFARSDRDELTREVDDAAYHPDLADAVLYAMRPLWISYGSA
jgi:hypothetical protein